MNTKRLAVILIAVAFVLIVMFSGIAIFAVKKIDVEFAVADDTDVSDVKNELEKYLGKNLMFLKTEDVFEALSDFHYMQVLSVEKSFPNVLKVSVEERREIYYLEHADKVYVTTAEGFVLKVLDANEFGGNTERDKITLKISQINLADDKESDVELSGNQVGSIVEIKDDAFLSTVFEMAKSVKLTDCIKELKVQKTVNGSVVAARDILITTYTGVKIRLFDADNNGLEKIERAFVEYDNSSTDYKKTFNYILTYESNGQIVVEWSPVDNSPLDSTNG